MNTRDIVIDGRPVGTAYPPYIVAEISANHCGDPDRALALITAAKAAGADAVKLQTYTADTLTIDHDGPGFRIEQGLWHGRTLYELYQEAATPWEWHAELFARARALGITIFSTPFDASAVDFLETLNSPAYKIASFELVDLPLIEKVAGTGKPLIMSTGMADLDEIEAALAAAHGAGCREICLLHCVSGYPTPVEDSHLRVIPHLARRFQVVVGLSDHTLGTVVPVAGVAQGAAMVEKHFTLCRADGGPDAGFSLEPGELSSMVGDCRVAWQALGEVNYDRAPSERASAVYRRSLYVVKSVRAGELLSEDNVRSIRPGYGLPPRDLPRILGRRARFDIARGTPLSWDLMEGREADNARVSAI